MCTYSFLMCNEPHEHMLLASFKRGLHSLRSLFCPRSQLSLHVARVGCLSLVALDNRRTLSVDSASPSLPLTLSPCTPVPHSPAPADAHSPLLHLVSARVSVRLQSTPLTPPVSVSSLLHVLRHASLRLATR